jgi:protein involved in polysaccharide export with SLBB domain
VFVLGEAKKPGSYTVSGLSTLTSALYASGGVSLNGSLRDIQLKRQGNIVRRLDLYDLLLRGDTSNDAKLLPGDVIFIPPVGPVASIDGEVRRPAIYELKGNVTVGNLVTLAGGLTTDADAERASLVRIAEDRRRVALDAAAGNVRASTIKLENGDALSIARIRPTLDAGIVLEGHVFRPGTVAWREGIRLTEVIRSVDELKPNADLGYVLIRRELPLDRRVVVLSADLAAALRQPGSEADVALSARSIASSRAFSASDASNSLINASSLA